MNQKQTICSIASEKESVIAGINQAVWSYAEFGYQEERSAAKIQEVLQAENFEVEAGIAGIPTAFVGRYGNGKPVIGILAEYDALPELSQKAGIANPCINEQNVVIPVFFPELCCGNVVLITDRVNQFVGELLGGYIENLGAGVVLQYKMGDGVHQVSFPQSHASIYEKRVVDLAR